jgi:hypothetical protein
MSYKVKAVAALAALIFSVAAHADGFAGAIGYAESSGKKGFEVEVGYKKTFGSLEFDLIPLSGIFYQAIDQRYRSEIFSNGAEVCRDTYNGQFSNKENCDSSFSYAAVVSGDFRLTDKFLLGGGLRIGEKANLFASLKYSFSDSGGVRLRAGSDYVSAAIFFGY